MGTGIVEAMGIAASAGGELVEADGDRLAEIHGRLAGVGGDLDEQMAPGEVFAGEAVFFRTEDEGDAGGAFLFDIGSEIRKGEDGLLGLAMSEGSGADDEGAVGDGLGQALCAAGLLEDIFRPDSRLRFAPVGLVGRNDGEIREAEVGHGAGGGADVEGIARRDQHDADGIGFRGQKTIVVPRRARRRERLVATLLLPMACDPILPDTDSFSIAADELCRTARWCYTQGWVPATSGNFSVRERASGRIRVTASGLDKGLLTREGMLEIDAEGQVLSGAGRPSAETGLHLVLYKAKPEAGAILHVHTVWNTLISGIHAGAGQLTLTGYELLKGLSGVVTHEHVEQVPILANSQDYEELTSRLAEALDGFPHAHGVLLSRHGLYTWGASVAEARRHLEALEFLFEVEGRQALGGGVGSAS